MVIDKRYRYYFSGWLIFEVFIPFGAIWASIGLTMQWIGEINKTGQIILGSYIISFIVAIALLVFMIREGAYRHSIEAISFSYWSVRVQDDGQGNGGIYGKHYWEMLTLQSFKLLAKWEEINKVQFVRRNKPGVELFSIYIHANSRKYLISMNGYVPADFWKYKSGSARYKDYKGTNRELLAFILIKTGLTKFVGFSDRYMGEILNMKERIEKGDIELNR
jgi:hypothetical protein